MHACNASMHCTRVQYGSRSRSFLIFTINYANDSDYPMNSLVKHVWNLSNMYWIDDSQLSLLPSSNYDSSDCGLIHFKMIIITMGPDGPQISTMFIAILIRRLIVARGKHIRSEARFHQYQSKTRFWHMCSGSTIELVLFQNLIEHVRLNNQTEDHRVMGWPQGQYSAYRRFP